MFKEGDLVEYQKTLFFIIAEKNLGLFIICPVNKIDLFGSEKDRIQSIVKNSITVHQGNLKLNDTGRLEYD